MLLCDLCFPSDGLIGELYYRANGNAVFDSGKLFIQNGEVSFDTYFNSFSSNKYFKYTELTDICFKLTVEGSATLTIYEADTEGAAVLCSRDISCDEPTEISVRCPLSDKDGAILYPTIRSDKSCIISGMGYYSEFEGRAVSAAVIICTFRREEYVYRNLKRFADFGIDLAVLLVDNGRTIDEDKIRYPNVRVYRNKNYGGSGGFTRGMIEALRDGGFTHIILMDDDISIDCVSLIKTIAFLKYIKPEFNAAGIAGGMLERKHPCRQYEASAKWENGKIIHLNQGLDLRKRGSLVLNEMADSGNYGAWWYLCMPVSTIRKNGLPFPFFIKTDDIEFGIRALDNVIVMNGIGVWHDSFDGKFSYYLEYYIKRNELVCNAIHEKRPLKLAVQKLFFGLGKCLVSYNYDCTKYIVKAFDDYLKGPDFFINADEEKINAQLCEGAEKKINITELGAFADYKQAEKDDLLLRIVTLNGYLIPSCFLKRNIRAVPWAAGHPQDYFGFKQIAEIERSSGQGVLREMKKRWLFIEAWLFIKYLFKLLLKNRKTVLSYRGRMEEITSSHFWCGHLEIAEI